MMSDMRKNLDTIDMVNGMEMIAVYACDSIEKASEFIEGFSEGV